jgi:tRNA dimethylallyltransferase
MNLFRKKTVMLIVGPTGVGKTDLSVLIAKKLPVEIVSADSRQIYKYLNVGTGKPSQEILYTIPHHFIDICKPDQYYSAGQFGMDARDVVKNIIERGNIPLIVGGSGLYIRALLEGFFDGNAYNQEIRDSLKKRMENEGLEVLYQELKKIDKMSAIKIHSNNSQRILRALEVFYTAGETLSNLQQKKLKPFSYPQLKIGINKKRQLLYKDINKRVDQMFEAGLVDEVKNILVCGYDKHLNSLNTVGYKEVIQYLEEKINYETCVKQVKQNSRRYAKRQLTWFRADKEIQWFEIENSLDLDNVCVKMIAMYEAMSLFSKPKTA